MLTYGHTWRRPEATLQTFLQNMRAAATAGIIQSVAVEALSLHADGSLYALPTGSNSTSLPQVPSLYLPCTFPVPSLYLPCTFLPTGSNSTSLPQVVSELQSLHLGVYGWFLNVDKAVSCPMLRAVWANPAPLVAGLVQAATSGGWVGIAVDLEPPASGCFPKDGVGFVKFLKALSSAARAAGKEVLVYSEQWQYHGLHTLFDYAQDAAATDGCLIGLTYDGTPPIKKYANWEARLNYSVAAVAAPEKR